jgi:hypothetical protein
MKRLRLLIAAAAAILAGCTSGSVEPLPEPPEVSVPPTSSYFPDYSGVSLEGVDGTTSTSSIEMQPGGARITGRVAGPRGSAAGATVVLERLVGDQSASLRVTANDAGIYSANDLLGGRYRVRAFRAPDATTTSAQVFFLGATENRTLDLRVSSYSGVTNLRADLAGTPIVGESTNLTITVVARRVDESGVARSLPVSDTGIELRAQSGRSITSPSEGSTNGSGQVQFTLRCNSTSSQGLTAVLDNGATYNLNVPPCQERPPEPEENEDDGEGGDDSASNDDDDSDSGDEDS